MRAHCQGNREGHQVQSSYNSGVSSPFSSGFSSLISSYTIQRSSKELGETFIFVFSSLRFLLQHLCPSTLSTTHSPARTQSVLSLYLLIGGSRPRVQIEMSADAKLFVVDTNIGWDPGQILSIYLLLKYITRNPDNRLCIITNNEVSDEGGLQQQRARIVQVFVIAYAYAPQAHAICTPSTKPTHDPAATGAT